MFQTFLLPLCSGFGGFHNSQQAFGLGPTANGNYGEIRLLEFSTYFVLPQQPLTYCFASTGYGRMSYEPQPAVMGPEAPGNYGIK